MMVVVHYLIVFTNDSEHLLVNRSHSTRSVYQSINSNKEQC